MYEPVKFTTSHAFLHVYIPPLSTLHHNAYYS